MASTSVTVAAVQAAPLPASGLPVFGRDDTLAMLAADAESVSGSLTGAAMVVYPEFHLFGTDHVPADERDALLRAAAAPLEGDLIRGLGEIARANGVWLIPGSICERGADGAIYNTAPVFSPSGELAGSYRKIFPWRPFEWSTPGDRFVTVDLPDLGRVGLSICYDTWFPEVGRHLAWMGADLIVNVVKTTTPDRPQELVLTRATSIANQVFTVSVNTAGPTGRGCSMIVDPEGAVLQEVADDAPAVMYERLDLGLVDRVRETGTAGTNRMWSQFFSSDPSLDLPLYAGRIDPGRWSPAIPPLRPGTSTPRVIGEPA